jgi:uncharacterized membrane protein
MISDIYILGLSTTIFKLILCVLSIVGINLGLCTAHTKITAKVDYMRCKRVINNNRLNNHKIY